MGSSFEISTRGFQNWKRFAIWTNGSQNISFFKVGSKNKRKKRFPPTSRIPLSLILTLTQVTTLGGYAIIQRDQTRRMRHLSRRNWALSSVCKRNFFLTISTTHAFSHMGGPAAMLEDGGGPVVLDSPRHYPSPPTKLTIPLLRTYARVPARSNQRRTSPHAPATTEKKKRWERALSYY